MITAEKLESKELIRDVIREELLKLQMALTPLRISPIRILRI
jgi:hypothetical protein